MNLPIEALTPRQIVAELDRYIVGQTAAKRAVAVALRNRYRRQQLPQAEREDVLPKNILMIGPTGVGKTEIARRLAQLARAPFIKVEATKFTEVGYVGRDVESMVRDLVSAAVRLVETEKIEAVREEAERMALERLAELLDKEPEDEAAMPVRPMAHPFDIFSAPVVNEPESDDHEWEEWERARQAREAARQVRFEGIKARLAAGEMLDEYVEVDVEESSNPFVQVFSQQGIEEMGIDGSGLGGAFGTKIATRRVMVREAKDVLFEQEAQRMIDRSGVNREALMRAEQTGIIFLDEIDKVAGASGGSGPDVSREGVQRDLLPIIEGSTVQTKFGPVKTDHVLFIAAGAFHISKPDDLIPELQGRLPIRVVLEDLTLDDFRKILREPKNALTKQYEKLLKTEGVALEFTTDALDEMASVATAMNEKLGNIGARRLHTMMEKLLEDVLFDAPEDAPERLVVDAAHVRAKLG